MNSNNASEDNAGGGFPVEPFLVTNAVNNNLVIRFTDSENTNNSWLETASNTSTGNLSITSIFKTAQSESSATNFTDSPALVSAETGRATDDWALGISQGKPYVNATTNNADNIRPVTSYTDNVARIATDIRVQASNGIGINLHVNSANLGSATSIDAAGTIAIGGYDIDGQYDGDIGEVIVFDQVLSATYRARVESYLSVKYGITRTITGLSEAAEDYLAADGGVI